MSELKDIYKFLFDYFKLYKESSSQNVTKWKQIDLNNALKWSNGVEEFYKKIANRKCYTKFIDDIKLIIKHWNLTEEICEDLLKNATKFLKKSLLLNKNLSDDLRYYILDNYQSDLKDQDLQNQPFSDDITLLDYEIDKVCLKICFGKTEPYLIDVLLDYSINKRKDIEFVFKLFDKIKKFDYNAYKDCFLRLLNKRYSKIFMENKSFKLFELDKENLELINAYFCYLILVFGEIIDDFRVNNKDIRDPKNNKNDLYDLNKLIDHFENAISLSNNAKFIKIIQYQAKKENGWNFLINQLKLKFLKETDCYLENLNFYDEKDF